MAIGTWATTHHFRPLLDDQQDLATQCIAARDNLAGLVQEQGKALGDLTLAANERQAQTADRLRETTRGSGELMPLTWTNLSNG